MLDFVALLMILAGIACIVRPFATVKRVGALTFVRIGRVGGSFYIARR